MDDSIEIQLLKIITLGNSSVGKTSIIKQYTNKTFEADLINTIGIDLKNHETTIEGIKIKVRIWDTAGQERFRSIQKQYYNQVDGILFVYDITNRESFEIIPQWLESVNEIANDNNVIGVLLGNKSDLDDMRVVSKEEGELLGNKYNFKFFETSALNGECIDQAFHTLFYEIIKQKNLLNKKDDNRNSYEVIEKDSKNKNEKYVHIKKGKDKNLNNVSNRDSFALKNDDKKPKTQCNC